MRKAVKWAQENVEMRTGKISGNLVGGEMSERGHRGSVCPPLRLQTAQGNKGIQLIHRTEHIHGLCVAK